MFIEEILQSYIEYSVKVSSIANEESDDEELDHPIDYENPMYQDKS